MDKLDFLDGPAPAEPVVAPSAEPETTPAEPNSPVRDASGRFAPKEPAAEPQAAPAAEVPAATPSAEPAPAVPAKPPEGYVPLEALQSIRRELQELKQGRQPPPQRPEPMPAPDPYEDPDGFADYQAQQLAAHTWQVKTEMSQVMAYQQHGQEKVDEAARTFAAAVQQRPWLFNELQRSPHPYDYVVSWHAREQAMSKLNDPSRIEAFLAWEAAQAGAQAGQPPAMPPAPAAPVAPQAPQTPPRSIAGDPSAGAAKPGAIPIGPEVAFDMTFKD